MPTRRQIETGRMAKYLAAATRDDALAIAERVMNSRRAPNNPNGDGLPYVTRYSGDVSTDETTGTSYLEVALSDEDHLTSIERAALLNVNPLAP